jgi:hypothetical protein
LTLTDIGEFMVGAHLQVKPDCDVVDYNVRPRGGGLAGLEEIDVVGFNYPEHRAYLCEVTTHIRGVLADRRQLEAALERDQHAIALETILSTRSHRCLN